MSKKKQALQPNPLNVNIVKANIALRVARMELRYMTEDLGRVDKLQQGVVDSLGGLSDSLHAMANPKEPSAPVKVSGTTLSFETTTRGGTAWNS